MGELAHKIIPNTTIIQIKDNANENRIMKSYHIPF
jgi:hypothetical protein